jgi:hypothetical protein
MLWKQRFFLTEVWNKQKKAYTMNKENNQTIIKQLDKIKFPKISNVAERKALHSRCLIELKICVETHENSIYRHKVGVK